VHTHPAVAKGCQCPDCGGRLRYLDKDQAEMLEFVPGYFKVICHVRDKHSCVRCARIVQAGAPSRPIQRGLPGPALPGPWWGASERALEGFSRSRALRWIRGDERVVRFVSST